ncbi:Adenylate and Guanylate cyclase catalytic domain-containing protein [Nonomuraea maritima]|uniref:Adenylate and Guanylate cyclase catalytic domain-containing protein n=1 Tax=Nonomuraea maritima TaxID=683260 RepID=A0A1G8XRC9_9ACTN|nr:adenylate/guanylate cyclase domain-containing protein [Nonomuraea maritima]SDJ93232.1 Adenylate and Guanylate cyclase catalytic domain-containing protein [Nonomuraea maritima]
MSTPQPPGTLTTATILFTDVVSSTALRVRLGEERANVVFRRLYELLHSVVTANGSTFTKSLGDGLMAVFGSATAGLDGVIAVQQAVADENERAADRISVRAALAAGDVCWGLDDVSGLPTVEAARLVAVAEGGQVLCTDLVRRLAQGRGRHEFKDLGRLPGKGLREPLHTYELHWQSAAHHLGGALAPWLDEGHVLPFVGREEELRTLDSALAAAEFGSGLVVLEGDPGAGKTRLASEVARRALKRQFTVLAGRCTNPARQAYEPIAGAVERLARSSPALLLRAGVDQRCGQLVRLAPSLGAPPLSLQVPPATEPVSERYHLMAAARTLVERLAAVRPVLLVIDDLQWATLESLQMLGALMWEAEALPLLVLAVSRPVPVDSAASATGPELHRLTAGARVVQVPAFRPEEVSLALDGARASGDAELLHRITGGNAFLVSEVVRELAAGQELDALAVPDAVTRMVVARLAQLHPDARELVSLLAVGERMEFAELRAGLGLDGVAGEARFVAAVEEAMGAGLVTTPANGSCQFSHALTRNALYATLSPPRAALLHGRVADAVCATDPTALRTRPYVVAAHVMAAAEHGRDPARVSAAVDAGVRAAEHALAGLAHREAVAWYQRVLDLLADFPATTPERRAELLVECGRAMWLAGDPQARPTLLEAADLAREHGRGDLIVLAALGGDRGFSGVSAAPDEQRIALLTEARRVVDSTDVSTRALLAAMLASELIWAPGGERRFALSDEAVALARKAGDPRTLASVLGMRSLTIVPADPLHQRHRDGDEMLEAARRTGDDLVLFHAYVQRTPPVLDSGDAERAGELLDRAGELAHRLGQPHLDWLLGYSRAGLTLMRGDLAQAEAEAEAAMRLGSEIGRRLEAVAIYSEQIAEIRRLQGRLWELRDRLRRAALAPRVDPVHAVLRYLCELDDEEAAPLLDRILAAGGAEPPRNMAHRPALDNLAVAASRLGRADLAGRLYDALSGEGETFGHGTVAHHCGHHYLAHLCVAAGDRERAAGHFEAAAEVHERRGVPLMLAESLLDWADLLDEGGTAGPDPADLRAWCRGLLTGRGAVLLERRLH